MPSQGGTPASSDSSYIDVEVLDAISFKIENGKSVVLSMANSNSAPWIVDDTGGGHLKKPQKPTSRSHMKRITNPKDKTQQLDIEVSDIMGFRDQNGENWILDMQTTAGEGPALFDQTDGVSGRHPTRRAHSERISDPSGDKEAPNFVTMQRCDNIAFRKFNGRVVVLSCPSADDGSGPRAPTFTTPKDYSPKNDKIIPPSLEQSGDKHNYVNFVKGAGGFFTGTEKIQMGPFWWIRKVKGNSLYMLLTINASNSNAGLVPPPAPVISLELGDPKDGLPHATLIDELDITPQPTIFQGSQTTIYFIWNNIVEFPTLDTYNISLFGSGVAQPYYTQFVTGPIRWGSTKNAGPAGPDTLPFVPAVNGGTDPAVGADGTYANLDAAQAAASAWNSYWDTRNGALSVHPDVMGATNPDGTVQLGGPGDMFAASLDISKTTGSSQRSIAKYFLLKVPSPETVVRVRVGNVLPKSGRMGGTSNISAQGYANLTEKPTRVTDLVSGNYGPPEIEPDAPIQPPDVVSGVNFYHDALYTITTKAVPGTQSAPNHLQIIVEGGTGIPDLG